MFISYCFIGQAKYWKYTRPGDCEGVYINRRKTEKTAGTPVCYYHCGAQDTDAEEGQYPMCQDCANSKLQPTLRMENIQSTRAKMLKKWKKNTVYNCST